MPGPRNAPTCHAKEHAAWKGSDHDLAMQVADEKSVLGDFANAKFAYAGTTSTFSRRDGKFFVNTDGPDGKLADFEIKYAFGVRPLQQYLIELPGGRMQALGIAWDSRPKAQGGQRWFHLYPGQNIKAGDPLHWTGVQQNWNFQCAECHSTNLRKNFDAEDRHVRHDVGRDQRRRARRATAPARTTSRGRTSRATGRRSRRARASRSRSTSARASPGRRWPRPATRSAARRGRRPREIETCARCHGRASRISDDYVHGKPPLDTHRLALLDDGLYWNDGQMRDEVYNWGSFVQSRMHAQGVTCSDCHEPHSLKLRAPGNARVRAVPSAGEVRHARSTRTTPRARRARRARRATCRRRRTWASIRGTTTRCAFRGPTSPRKLGAPNACNNCHAKQTAQWAADAIRQWTGKPPASYQNFAAALRAGSLGAPGARGALLGADRGQGAAGARARQRDRSGSAAC